MTVKVRFDSVAYADTNWDDQPLAAVNDKPSVVVAITFTGDLNGGRFRIEHPGITPIEFDVPKRKATGSFRIGGRKPAPVDFTRVETMKCRVTCVAATAVPEAFALVAVTNCDAESSGEQKMRVYATDSDVKAAQVLVRVGADNNLGKRLGMTRGGSTGETSKTGNTLRSYTRFYAQFFFKDPVGVERKFPAGMPVKVMLGAHADNAIEAAIVADGKLIIEMIGYTEVIEKKVLKLRFGAPSTNNFAICELPSQPESAVLGPEPAAADAAGNHDKRFFKFPRKWALKQVDWTVTSDDARWDAAKGQFSMVKDGKAASLGSKATPVKLVLDPHWQYLKFEFFDRYFGHSDHADAVQTMPGVTIVGDRQKPSVGAALEEDTKSNWWIKDGDDVIQCVPWVLQRRDTGAAAARPCGDEILTFTLPPNAAVHSTSATDRARVIATAEQLRPGPERLKFYDLPVAWNSRNYFATLSPAAGDFGWYEDVAAKATTKVTPLKISLDDIVLTDENNRRIATWNHDNRLTIFAHTFDDTVADCSKEGVYKADAAGKEPWYSLKPATTAPEALENYIVGHPNWTRLIAAQGSLFEVFDRRTVESSPVDPSYDVIGARAAVRWIDVTKRLGTTTVGSFTGPSAAWAWHPQNEPAPGRRFFPAFPARTDHPTMSIQPYYKQEYVARFGKYVDAADSKSEIGRFDMVLLRCCGVEDVAGTMTEVGLNLCFHKLCFDATVAPSGMGLDDFQVAFVDNLHKRWNGYDAVNAEKRPVLLPRDAAKPIKVPVLTFIQITPEPEAHYKVELTDHTIPANARDSRGMTGTGKTQNHSLGDFGGNLGFTNAHEHGHQAALADEYNERWNDTSYNWPSFSQLLPGDPFELDGRSDIWAEAKSPLMNGMMTLHNRYFWQSAEWVRRVVTFPMKVKLGDTYEEYFVPPHTNADRSYGFWPLNAALNDFALPAVPPLTANRGKVNLFLYALGKDNFAVGTLPKREGGAGATPYDGILVITVLLKVGAWGAPRTDLEELGKSFTKVARRTGTRKLNHKWYATGTHATGTQQAWEFTRCLIHFSPRVLISPAAELPTVAAWRASLGIFAAESIVGTVAAKLTTYLSVAWTNVSKPAAAVTMSGPVAEPTSNLAGDWATASVPLTPAVRPGGFGAIDTKISTYTSLAATAVLDRYKAAVAVRDAANDFLIGSGNAASPGMAAAIALRGRADKVVSLLGAMVAVRKLEKLAAAQSHNTLKTAKAVKDVQDVHGFHFEVRCEAGTTASTTWDPAPMIGDLPTATWMSKVPAGARTNTALTGLGTLAATYKSKKPEDLADRIVALTAIEAPVVVAPAAAHRGAWDTESTVADKPRPVEFATIDTKLGLSETGSGEAKLVALIEARQLALTVAARDGVDPAYQTAARELASRITPAENVIHVQRAVDTFQAHAKAFREHLERKRDSTTVTITVVDPPNTPGVFEDALLEVFPEMIGIAKKAASIEAADMLPLITPLGLTTPSVVAIA